LEDRDRLREPASLAAPPPSHQKTGATDDKAAQLRSVVRLCRRKRYYRLPTLITLYWRDKTKCSAAFARTQKSPQGGLLIDVRVLASKVGKRHYFRAFSIHNLLAMAGRCFVMAEGRQLYNLWRAGKITLT